MKSAKDIIEELNRVDEHQRVEAKSGSGPSTLETVCAFANETGLNGGTILIGVEREEDTLFPFYNVIGVDDPDKVSRDIASQCASVFNTPVRPNIHTEEVDGKTVLVVTVQEAANSEKPIYFKNKNLPQGAYRRIGSTDQKCTEDDLVALFSQRDTETYDEAPLRGAEMEDLDPEAIEYYRTLRKRVNPTAEELSWSDEDLLLSLSAIKKDKGEYLPTLGGILLFGSRKALRRLLPMARVDYIRIPGKEWIENPDERFSTTDMRGSLLRLVQRIQDQIFEDLPKAFALEEGNVQAKSQSLPAKVLREAIVNALMHASYRVHQPIQILRYSNRIEIRNPGYSLKNEDQLGEPGSRPRNPKIAAVFHETNLAETKGSGIRTMRKLMEESGFAPPTFESDRGNDLFTARLLLHHFLTPEDVTWLAQFAAENLNNAQKRALIFVRELGAIDNQTYRQLNAVDTMIASTDLRRLRDIGLLEKKGKSAATYYISGEKMQNSAVPLTTHQENPKTHQLETKTHQLSTKTHQLEIPLELQQDLEKLGKSPRKEKTRAVITKLCTWQALSAEQLTEILGKTDKKNLVRTHLNPMVNDGELAYTYPDMVNHPQQKYTVAAKNGGAK
ncbi:MAG: ATP-binding protein [Alphaproteobacteria bacterium]